MAKTAFLSLLISLFIFSPVLSFKNLSIADSQPATLVISPSLTVESSPGSKPGTIVLSERIEIAGFPRLKNLRKFTYSVKIEVSNTSSSTRFPNVEVCLHRNISLGVGMCPQGQWEKLIKGSWSKTMSPFDNRLLDIRVASSSSPVMEVSITEEFVLYRVIFLALGITLMVLASALSKSLIFYYSSLMAVGIILVILMVLFQGMKLLPTGRMSSVAIFVYGSFVGLGSLLLGYVPTLFRSVLTELGIGEDLYNPLALFLVLFLAITGAWLGFWVVRKVVLTEDGLIDIGVSTFVDWSIRIIAAVLILQSSKDPLLSLEALSAVVLFLFLFRRLTRSTFIRHFHKSFLRTGKTRTRRYQSPASPNLEYSHNEYVRNTRTPDTHGPFTMTSRRTPAKAFNISSLLISWTPGRNYAELSFLDFWSGKGRSFLLDEHSFFSKSQNFQHLLKTYTRTSPMLQIFRSFNILRQFQARSGLRQVNHQSLKPFSRTFTKQTKEEDFQTKNGIISLRKPPRKL